MVRAETIRRNRPEDLKADIDQFFTDKKLAKTEIISVNLTESDVALTVIIVYDDGKTS